jgi:hypothetical protein
MEEITINREVTESDLSTSSDEDFTLEIEE